MRLLLACVSLATTAAAALQIRPVAPLQRSRSVVAQLPYPWEERVDDSGSVFYSNPHTGATQWDPPVQGGGQALWRLDEFFGGHGGVTGYSTGGILPKERDQLPYLLRMDEERVLSRWNMREPKITVSRIQAAVQVLPDGQLYLTAKGRSPTMYREGYGAPWVSLEKGDALYLGDGDHVSLNCNDPEAAVFVCQQEGAADAGGAVQYSEDGLWMWNGAEWVPSGQ